MKKLYNVAAGVVDLIEADDEEAAKAALRAKIQAAGLEFYEGEITSPTGIDAFESEDEENEEDEREAHIASLADLGGMDPATENVAVLAEHRQSCDGPAIFGPYATAEVARRKVMERYRSGDFDVDGCTVEYRRVGS